MTEPIKLPPLPEPTYRSPSGTGNYFDGYTKQTLQAYATAAAEPYRKALHDLIRDLEMRSNLKRGDDKGVVDCGNGVYLQALMALSELK